MWRESQLWKPPICMVKDPHTQTLTGTTMPVRPPLRTGTTIFFLYTPGRSESTSRVVGLFVSRSLFAVPKMPLLGLSRRVCSQGRGAGAIALVVRMRVHGVSVRTHTHLDTCRCMGQNCTMHELTQFALRKVILIIIVYRGYLDWRSIPD